MNMMKYASTTPKSIVVPVVNNPGRLRLREIIIDADPLRSNFIALLICTGRCDDEEGFPYARYLLRNSPDQVVPGMLDVDELADTLVFSDRFPPAKAFPTTSSAPTIEVGVFDNRRMAEGELFYDPFECLLVIGYPPEEKGRLYLRCGDTLAYAEKLEREAQAKRVDAAFLAG